MSNVAGEVDQPEEKQKKKEEEEIEATSKETEATEPKAPIMLKIASSEGEIFEIPKKAAFLSRMIKRLLEAFGVAEDESYDQVIPLPKVDAETFRLVVEWCYHHIDDPPVVEIDPIEKNSDEINVWDREFFKNFSQKTLFDIIMAANFLDIYMLMDAGTKTVANIIKSSNSDQLRQFFELECDITPEEAAQLRSNHPWISDDSIPPP